jgi:hypothetical protein
MVLRFSRAIIFGFAVSAFACSGVDSSATGEDTSSQTSAVTPAPWGASYVSQSFPLATSALKMKAGEVIPSYIELKNSGTETWDTSTRIGTTEPRDRVSVFADSTWVNASRPSQVTGTVPPGGTFKFTFDLKAPSTPGTYKEYFGVLEEGVVWFGDTGQGGPVDSDLEVMVEVSAADPVPDAGVNDEDSGDDSGAPISVSQIPEGADAGDVSHDPTTDPSDAASSGGKSGGCSMIAGSSHFYGSNAIGIFFVIALGASLRRRKK